MDLVVIWQYGLFLSACGLVSWAPDFGGKARPPQGQDTFQGCSNHFERLKRHLAVSLRTQESAFGRIGTDP